MNARAKAPGFTAAGTARATICWTTSRLTTFSDGVRGNSSKTSIDSGHVYLATPSALEELLQLGERRRRRGRRLRMIAAHARSPRRSSGSGTIGDLVDGRVAQDHGLDLGRHDRHAAAADDVLAAADVDEVAVLVEIAEVAGPVAAPAGQRLARQLVVVEEAEEAARAVDDDLADLAGAAAARRRRRGCGSRCRRTGGPRCDDIFACGSSGACAAWPGTSESP